MSTATALQPTQDSGKLSDWARSKDAQAQISAAIGPAMDPGQFTTHMLVAFQAPEVRRCSIRSQTVAFMECAALGLLPTLNQIKLIPYKDDIKAMPQWQGLKALMERHPDVLEVDAQLVHITDEFGFRDGVVSHSYDPLSASRTIASDKDIRGGYAKILYRNGRPPKFHIVPVAQITKCQRCAQTQNVWRAWYEQMALKTVLRDCYARRAVPVDPLVAERLERAFAINDVNLGNDARRGEQVEAQSRIGMVIPASLDASGVIPGNPPADFGAEGQSAGSDEPTTPMPDSAPQQPADQPPAKEETPPPTDAGPSAAEVLEDQYTALIAEAEASQHPIGDLTALGEQIGANADLPEAAVGRLTKRLADARDRVKSKRGGKSNGGQKSFA